MNTESAANSRICQLNRLIGGARLNFNEASSEFQEQHRNKILELEGEVAHQKEILSQCRKLLDIHMDFVYKRRNQCVQAILEAEIANKGKISITRDQFLNAPPTPVDFSKGWRVGPVNKIT